MPQTPPKLPPVLLTIAGFDPSSGAGITADLKVFAAHGCYGIAGITALTVQSTTGVRQVQPLDAALVASTLGELAEDFAIAAVKIGMLGSGAVAEAVREFLEGLRPQHCVLDPILRSSLGSRRGAELIDEAGKAALPKLFSLASVITPNWAEAAELTGVAVRDGESARRAAAELHRMGARAVVITGGDASAAEAADLLSVNEDGQIKTREFTAPKVQSRSTHGTGCVFSSAIAAHLALGARLPEAVARAKRYVREAILNAPLLGHGNGPLGI